MANYKNLKSMCTKHATIFIIVTIINLDYKLEFFFSSTNLYFIYYWYIIVQL